MFSHEGQKTFLIFSGLYIAPDKISRKFILGFKESRKLHYKFKTEFSRCWGFLTPALFNKLAK